MITCFFGTACVAEEGAFEDELVDQHEDELAAAPMCTDHQGCFYVNRYAGNDSSDSSTWTYHAKNCVDVDGACKCPAITPWTILLNTCEGKRVKRFAEEVEVEVGTPEQL